VVFHEITDDALKYAFSHPQDLDMNKVNAQIARRILDRIVGYLLSPLLWKKIVRGLSAGRVQSVTLKFIIEREKEITNFVSKTTYTIIAKFKTPDGEFEAKLNKYRGKKAVFDNEKSAKNCINNIKKEVFLLNQSLQKRQSVSLRLLILRLFFSRMLLISCGFQLKKLCLLLKGFMKALASKIKW